jgi:hypothetical protein
MEMNPTSAQDVRAGAAIVAARVRAALAYSGDGLAEIGERSRLGQAKLRRIASQKNPRGAMPDELWAIADACGVPRAWLEIGEWNDLAGQADVPAELSPLGAPGATMQDRLELVERYLLALLKLEASRVGELPLPDVADEISPRLRELVATDQPTTSDDPPPTTRRDRARRRDIGPDTSARS